MSTKKNGFCDAVNVQTSNLSIIHDSLVVSVIDSIVTLSFKTLCSLNTFTWVLESRVKVDKEYNERFQVADQQHLLIMGFFLNKE